MIRRILWHTFGLTASIAFAICLAGLTGSGTHTRMLPVLVWAVLTAAAFVAILRYAAWYRGG